MTPDQVRRYARHIILPEVGGAGQQRLLGARVCVAGAGGLGAASLLYLAAAGVGSITVIDDDQVDLSNLQRQVVHDTAAVGMAKVESAAGRLPGDQPGCSGATGSDTDRAGFGIESDCRARRRARRNGTISRLATCWRTRATWRGSRW